MNGTARKSGETNLSPSGLPHDPHPIVAALLAELTGELSPFEKRRLCVRNALMNAAEARGHAIVHPDEDSWRVWFVIHGERVDWWTRERYSTRSMPLTKRELKSAPAGKPYKQELHPTGFLVLTIKADYSSEKVIYEKPQRPFEDRIEELLDQFEALAAHAIEQKNYWADWERRRLKKLAQRRQKERLRAIEEQRWAKLRRMAADWEETERLRKFVGAVGRRLAKLKDRPARADLWIEWARRRIDALDPFRSDPRFIYETAVQKPRRRVLSDYEREFGEPDPDEDDD